jgi:tetratricopeptide (TPR) repeat protein
MNHSTPCCSVVALTRLLPLFSRRCGTGYVAGAGLHEHGLRAKKACHQAIEQFHGLEYQPNLPEAHYNLGLVYAQLGEHNKAIRAFREAIRYRPSYVEAHASLGAALLETGRQEEARAAFERVIALAPDSEMAIASRKQLKHLTP